MRLRTSRESKCRSSWWPRSIGVVSVGREEEFTKRRYLGKTMLDILRLKGEVEEKAERLFFTVVVTKSKLKFYSVFENKKEKQDLKRSQFLFFYFSRSFII